MTDPMSFLYRAQLVQSRVHRLADEAQRTSDPDKLEALASEATLCLENLRSIHEEQLVSLLRTEQPRRASIPSRGVLCRVRDRPEAAQ